MVSSFPVSTNRATTIVAPSPERPATQQGLRRTPQRYPKTKIGKAATSADSPRLPWRGVSASDWANPYRKTDSTHVYSLISDYPILVYTSPKLLGP